MDFSKIKAKAVIKGVDNIYFVQFSTSSDAKMAMSEISNWSNIVYVEPDSYSGDASNGEPDNSEDSFLSWGVTKIGADKFAKSLASKSTTEIKVAVVDTGVSKHSFLGNRRTDDGYDFYDNDSDPSDPKGHGTHVSGTIVDCTPGLNVKIMPVRVLGLNGGYSSTVGMGIRYAADHGAKVINLSLGGKHSNFKDDNIKYAVSKGVTVVVSAGNEYGSIDSLYYCPAHIPEAICVGAIDSYENKANFSNIGSALDVVAPGVGIVSCVPGGSYESWDGTSMAAPHVSALAAMVMLENPSYTPAQIEQTIKNNCKDLGTFGRDNIYGCGVPDFSKYAAVIPSSISLNKTSATIETGKTVSLTATITPSNATDKTVTWSSSNTSIATVSGGIVTGKSVGNATITAKTNNGKTATCIVTVKNSIVEVTGITLNSTNISLEAGETTTLIASITPSNATDQTITWSSSNTSVATVSNGIVTGQSAGTATIMATTSNAKTAICNVKVTPVDIKVPINIYIVPKNVSVELGKSITLDATIQPKDASNKTVTWYSSNTNIATVNNGIVSGKAIGKVTITAKTVNGYTATSTVEVGRSKQTNHTPVLVYKDKTGYHEIDSGYGSSFTRVNKASDLYIKYYIDTELSVDAQVKISVTDKNANSGVYDTGTYGRSLQQGLYAYYRVADKLKYQQGKNRVYVELKLANGTVPDGYKMERGDSFAFYLDFY